MIPRVWKYALTTPTRHLGTGPAEVHMQAGAEILSAGVDPATGGIAVWAKVDPGEPRELRGFWLSFTGDPVPPGVDFVDTVVVGALVWHVWVQRSP